MGGGAEQVEGVLGVGGAHAFGLVVAPLVGRLGLVLRRHGAEIWARVISLEDIPARTVAMTVRTTGVDV